MLALTTILSAASAFLGTAPVHAVSPPSGQTTSITIDASSSGTPINSKVFGQFIKGADNFGIFSIPHPDLAVLHEGTGIWDPSTQAPRPEVMDILRTYRPGAFRFPGGLSVHNYDWKQTIGPVEERGDWKFGLDEFMVISEALQVDPIIVVSEYIGTPQDAADLVEYLNMPAQERYPWAMKRAANGHPQPYGVQYFEMGNESWVDWRKNHATAVRSPADVGRYASELAAAMKAVDPTIKCGVPFEPHDEDWSNPVLSNITDDIDFVVVHMYPVKYGGRDMEGDKEREILEAMMASGYMASQDLIEYEDQLRDITGRSLPLAITEYNMGPTQQQPNLQRPYRYTLAAALGTGDFLGNIMDPSYDVCAAIYWNFLNGFFGAVQTYAGHPWKTLEKLDTPLLRPNHYIFELWGRYRGENILPVAVETETLDFSGYARMKPALGKNGRVEQQISKDNIFENARPLTVKNPNVSITPVNDGWDIQFTDVTGSDFSNFAILDLRTLPAEMRPPQDGLVYEVSYEAKWEQQSGNTTPNIGLGLMDNRGYQASGSAIAIRGAQAAEDWTGFSADYQPLEDTSGIVLLSRLEASAEPVSGTLKIRDFKITPWLSGAHPARPALTAYATRSSDGSRIYLVVFNLTIDEDIPAQIGWNDFSAQTVTYSEINAPSPAAVTFEEGSAGWVVDNEQLPLESATSLQHTFPAHSATGFIIEAGSH